MTCRLCAGHLQLVGRAEFALKSIGSEASDRDEDEYVGECRIGAVAPMSDTLRVSGVSGSWHPRLAIGSASICAA
jgi:hypothetical protein